MTLAAGTKLDDYEVLGPLGAGGMGEVYRARDSVLKREVAIKVLPAFVSQDPDRLRRFEQEAQATAALNHPNILAIHRFGSYDGAPYLVLELLEGGTLGQQLGHGPLSVRKAIDYGIQIARGLTAAHEKGIVHRDLKPTNIFVTKDGRVKILDFGLAKLAAIKSGEPEGSTMTMEEGTQAGVVLGTAGYMAPEQVRGIAADHRADIFAFGAILYEMLAGKRAFRKPTMAETLTAILREDPPAISQIGPGTPPALQRIVQRCLEKNPEQRFQSASDLAFALDSVSESSSSSAAIVHEDGRWPGIWKVGAGAAVLLAAGMVAWWRIPPGVPVVESVTQLTDDGEPKDGRLVTDGSRVYFNEGPTGSWKIAQVSVAGGRTSLVDTRLVDPWVAALDSEGSALLTLDGGAGDGAYPVWTVPLPVGEPRRAGDLEGNDIALFPDGRILIADFRDLKEANKDGSDSRKILTLPGILEDPSVSPDGKRIVFTMYSRGWATSALHESAEDGSGERTIVDGGAESLPCCAQWSPDGKYLLYAITHGEASDIWVLPTRGGLFQRARTPVRLTAGPLAYSRPVPSRAGKAIFAIGAKRRAELVRFDLKTKQFVPFLSGISAIDPTFSKDGKWVAYTAYPDHTIWRSRPDGSERTQLTYPPMKVQYPALSPDGTKVAYTSSLWDVYVQGVDGGAPTLIKKHSAGGNWSPDGNVLVFTSFYGFDKKDPGKDRSYVQTFDLRTGKESRIPSSEGKGGGIWISQDVIMTNSPTGLMTFDLRTQKWTELGGGRVLNWIVTPDNRYVYVASEGAEPELRRIRLADHQVETITSLKNLRRVVDQVEGFTQLDVSPDGSPVFSRDIGTQEVYALNVRWP
jgi:eukaryotic-like serine/threonine-protein kinase